MTPQELKNSILQMAIQGKLVEQRPEEGTAEELYQQIQAEKQKLIKEKRIKKDKPLPEITEDEKPFDIPESWKWVRLGNILYKLTDGAHSTPKYTLNGVPFLSVKDMSSGVLDFSNCKYISEAEHNELYSRCNPEYGDLLLTKVGTTGIPVIVNTDQQFSLFVSVALLKFNQKLICNRFLQLLISSPLVQIQAAENTKGVGNKNWVMRDIANTIIILPPIAEQNRIVAKIEQLLPLIDRYEAAWTKLEAFNKRFPEDMQKSILQEAIQGKLVEQRPEEGTGEELYQQIQAEKQRLIAEKKIKKDKPLPEIIDGEKPFDIPDSWKWVRLADACRSIADGDHQAPPQVSQGIPFLVISNVSRGFLDFSQTRHVPVEYFKSLSKERIANQNDIIFTVTGSYGIPVIVNTNEQFCFQRHMALLKGMINKEYLYYLLKSPIVKGQCDKVATGTAQKTVGLKSLKSVVIPLPPLDEQKRIVAKIEQLLPLCERLK